MKMEFEIKSSYSTKIKHVIVKEGEQVEAGKILAIFQ
jgi:biotin carboxyl carrier protein